MKRFKALCGLSVLACALVTSVSQAEIVKFDFTAHGTAVDFQGTGPFAATGAGAFLAVGTQITGSFYYDTSLQATYTGSLPPGGSYADYFAQSGIGAAMQSNTGYSYKDNYVSVPDFLMPSVHLEDNGAAASNPDRFSLEAYEIDSHNARNDLTITLLAKPGLQPLSSSGLPTSLSLSDFDSNVHLWWSDNGGDRYFTFDAAIDSLTVTVVPEPDTYAMLAAGLLLMGAVARRQRRK